MKVCSRCKQLLEFSEFYKHPTGFGGVSSYCKNCSLEYYQQNKERALELSRIREKKNYTQRRIYKTLHSKLNPTSYLKRIYILMKQRCCDPRHQAYKWYGAKGIQVSIERDEFIQWSLNNDAFLKLHKEYVVGKFSRTLAPSIDRLDSTKDYCIDNMQWITAGLNTSKSSKKRLKKTK